MFQKEQGSQKDSEKGSLGRGTWKAEARCLGEHNPLGVGPTQFRIIATVIHMNNKSLLGAHSAPAVALSENEH